MKKTPPYSYGRILLTFTALLLFCSCGAAGIVGSSGAETQASLPISEEAGFTISSPNAQGLVTVVGTDAVPSGAIIIADVNAAASLNLAPLFRLANLIIPSAAASDCSIPTGLSECPDVNDDGKCYFVADAEGDSSFQVPAGVGDSITISYLDPTSCAETEVFNGAEVDNDTPILDMKVLAASFDQTDGILYTVGQTGDGVYGYRTVRAAEQDVISTDVEISTDSVGDVESIDFFRTLQSKAFVAIGGSDNLGIAQVSDTTPGALASDGLEPLFTGVATGQNWSFLSAEEFTNDGTEPACRDSIRLDTGIANYTRVFYTDGASLYFREFSGDFDESAANPPQIVIEDTANTSANYQVVQLLYFNIEDSASAGATAEIILSLDTDADTTNATTYYYFRLDRGLIVSELCSGPVVLALQEAAELRGFANADELQFSHAEIAEEGSTDTHLVIFDPQAQTTEDPSTGALPVFTMINRDTPVADCCDQKQLVYDAAAGTMSLFRVAAGTTTPVADSSATVQLSFTGSIGAFLSMNSLLSSELFLLASGYQGSDFFLDGTSAFEIDGAPELLANNPLAAFYSTSDASDGKIIALDPTSGDGTVFSTFVRFYDVRDL